MRLATWVASTLLLAWAVSAPASETTVYVGHRGFQPRTVTVAQGDTVIFLNVQEMPGGHTIVADDGSFSSPALAKDKSWSRTFEKAGTYGIHLKEHPASKGQIVVK